jgi:hypothetical protein
MTARMRCTCSRVLGRFSVAFRSPHLTQGRLPALEGGNIKVEVNALSSYEDKDELFKEQVDWISIYSIFSLFI